MEFHNRRTTDDIPHHSKHERGTGARMDPKDRASLTKDDRGPGSADQGQEKLDRWNPYHQQQSAQERVLRTLNLTEGLSIIFLFAYVPIAHYFFLPVSGIMWIVLFFGGDAFNKEVEKRFPQDKDIQEYEKDADERTKNPARWGEFFSGPSGRLFLFAIIQAGVIIWLFVR